MMVYSESSFVNDRGHKLFSVEYKPDEEVQAVVVWHHGLGEHVGRYDAVWRELAQAGVAVASFDASAHGKSEPTEEHERGLISDWHTLVDDLLKFADKLRPTYPPEVPFFLGGQSMGGMVAITAVLERPELWTGLILHSAMVGVVWSPVLRVQAMVGGLLSRLMPRARIVPAVQPEKMSVDPEVVEHYKNDPLNFVGNVRAKTGYEMLRGFSALRGRAPGVSVPIYAAHGTADSVTCMELVKQFLQESSSKDTTFNEFPGAYHELLMGPEKEKAIKDILQWIKAHATKK